MKQKQKHHRALFRSWWLPRVYDLWVWAAVLGRTKNLRRNILGVLPKEPEVIVDLATGTGENALLLKQTFPKAQVLASDLSEGMLEVAGQKAEKLNLEIEFSLQDAVRTSYSSGSADVVTISFALHDLPRKQRREVMKEAHRIVKPKGRFIIYEYHLPKNWLVRVPLFIQFLLVENQDAWDMLKEDLQDTLASVGFQNATKQTLYKGLAQIVSGEK